jgi:hypothetical protein
MENTLIVLEEPSPFGGQGEVIAVIKKLNLESSNKAQP